MKNRTAQLIFQSIYAALALVACVGSVGFYDMKFTSDFYIYFTNISRLWLGRCVICPTSLITELAFPL